MNAGALAEILARTDVWRGGAPVQAEIPALESGFPALDAELPGGGWAHGSLAEILSDGAGQGECALVLPALQRLTDDGRTLLFVAPPYVLHAPAWRAAGIDLERLLVVAPERPRDLLWTAEVALASGAPGAVLVWSERIAARDVRRLQVAAAGQATLAFLFRPLGARNDASAAALRLAVSAGARGRLHIELIKRRGPPCGRTLCVERPHPFFWYDKYNSDDSDDPDDSTIGMAGAPSATPPARSPLSRVFA